jgi:hypothetical protein
MTASGPAVRRVLKQEVVALFRAHYNGVDPAVDMESPRALEVLGGGCQGDMFMRQLKRVIAHCRPSNTFVPTSIEQVRSNEAVLGTLEQM